MLEAAVFDAVQAFVADGFGGGGDDWDRFRGVFCALETFWKEPVAARHEKEKIEGWLKLLAEAGGEKEPATRWAWLRREAKRRADELEAAIDRDLTVSDAVAALAEVNNEPGDPQPRQQLLLRSDGGTVTDAALAAVRSCTGATDLLVKSKLGLDETVLPPMLRVLAYALLPALKRALTDVAGRLDGIEVVCDDNKSVKKSKRMVAKMVNEIAEEEANKNAKDERWQPISASVRDALRATIVCPDEAAMCQVYEELKTPDGKFTLRKVKNKLKQKIVPFNLHAVYEFQPSPASVSILVEVQIKIKEIEDKCGAQHKFYEISRVTGSVELFKPEVDTHDEQTPEELTKRLGAHDKGRFMLQRSNVVTSRHLVERESKARKSGGWRLMRFISKRRGRRETVHPDQPPKAPPVRRAVQDEEEDDSDSYPISYP